MANAVGMIQESIWRDAHWRKLSRGAQALYVQLLSQKELDCAGILPLQPRKWAKGCHELTVDVVMADLEELERALFVIFDADTDEAFIRTYIRNSNVIKVPNMLKSARRSAQLVGSDIIKPFLADELRATGHPDCIAVAEEIDPSGTPPEPLQLNPSGTLPEPFPNPSKRNPSGTLSKGSGVGTGVGEGHLGSNSRGEGEPNLRPQCSIHEENHDGPCVRCGARRQWDEANADRLQADELQRRRDAKTAADQARADCELCDGDGWLLGEDGTPTEPAIKCTDHQSRKDANA